MSNNIIYCEVIPTPKGEKYPLPDYATVGSSGVDLLASIDENSIVRSRKREIIPTGLKLIIPAGLEGQVRSRSGLAYKNGIMVLNSPGTIDSDYRGEIKVILYNASDQDFIITPGMRIAQLVIVPIYQIPWEKVDSIDALVEHATERGSGGFGSTGTEKI